MPDFDDVLSLEALGPLDHFELHHLVFLQRAKSFLLDGGMVYENIGPVVPGNEPITFASLNHFTFPVTFILKATS